MSDDDRVFVEQVRQTLDRHAEALDEVTAARLAAARRKALKARQPRRYGLPVVAFSALAASILAVALFLNQDAGVQGLDADTLEQLAQSEDQELIENLDFYDWLDATQASS